MTEKTIRSVISKMIAGVKKATGNFTKDFTKEEDLTEMLREAILNDSFKEVSVSTSKNATGFFSTDAKNKRPDITLSANGELILVEVKLITKNNHKHEPRNALLQAIEYGTSFKPHSVILAYYTENDVTTMEIDEKTEALIKTLSEFTEKQKHSFHFFVVDLKKERVVT